MLYKIKIKRTTFWSLSSLPNVTQWIKKIHDNYMGKLSESACNQLKMDDVFKQCKLNKWGDDKHWRQQFDQYKITMSTYSANIGYEKKPITKLSIASSIVTKNTNNKDINNNIQCIEKIIALTNSNKTYINIPFNC